MRTHGRASRSAAITLGMMLATGALAADVFSPALLGHVTFAAAPAIGVRVQTTNVGDARGPVFASGAQAPVVRADDVTLETLHYASTIDPLPDLRARVAIPPGTGRVPIIVLMHGFVLDASSFHDATYRRFASTDGGAIVIGVDLRGRGGSSGTPDGGGREIHDIVDAIDAVAARHPARVAADAVHLIGYSGGGANVLSAAGRFPDRFASIAAFFPIADYGADRTLGWWWQCSRSQRAKLVEWIGAREPEMRREAASATSAAIGTNATRETAAMRDAEDAAPATAAAYASRAPVFAITNYRRGPLRLFHDRGDDNVPPLHSIAVQEEAQRAGMTNVEVSISETTDAVRWRHGAPNGDAPVRHAEPRIFATITQSVADAPPEHGGDAAAGAEGSARLVVGASGAHSAHAAGSRAPREGSRATPSPSASRTPDSAGALPRRGRLAIAGYLVTRPFSVWLGRGTDARGWVDYDLDARRFDITYDAAYDRPDRGAPAAAGAAEARAPWTIVLAQQRPGDRLTATINRQPFSGVADATGALRLTRAAP